MNIGIIGLGIVGSACKFGFELIGHNVSVHDIKLGTSIDSVFNTEVVFVSVPTPSKEDGSCRTDIVEDVVSQLVNKGYQGHIIIKSTVSPGTSEKLSKIHDRDISMVPEFLRERCAITDFTENHDLCVIGTNNDKAFEKIKTAHGSLPHKIVRLNPTEAEFVKYFNNAYNATLITFANCFYEICIKHGVDYPNVLSAIMHRSHISKLYLQCNKNFRGFGGVCLPKDLKALSKMAEGTNIKFFEDILDQNKKFKMTVFEGMRPE